MMTVHARAFLLSLVHHSDPLLSSGGGSFFFFLLTPQKFQAQPHFFREKVPPPLSFLWEKTPWVRRAGDVIHARNGPLTYPSYPLVPCSSTILIYSSTHLLIYSFIHLLIYSSTHLLIYSSTHLYVPDNFF